ncbi:hypothetical protein PMAYCL1PPCAC_04030, partial [Pristionchus mayeri]
LLLLLISLSSVDAQGPAGGEGTSGGLFPFFGGNNMGGPRPVASGGNTGGGQVFRFDRMIEMGMPEFTRMATQWQLRHVADGLGTAGR